MERHSYFENQGQHLLAAIHEPEGERLSLGLVYLHGWAGYRIGPHQMFTRMARRAAEMGFVSVRFDFRGRGDSGGNTGDTTLTTMVSDAIAATSFALSETGVAAVALVGDCSGSEVAIAAGPLHPAITHQVLWSAPIVAGSRASAQRARYRSTMGQYLGKLVSAETWRHALRGGVHLGQVARVLIGGGRGPGEGGSASDREIPWDERFAAFRGQRLFIYGGNDPATPSSLAHYRGLCRDGECTFHVVRGANHAFYSLAWEDEVITTSLRWLEHASRVPGDADRAEAS